MELSPTAKVVCALIGFGKRTGYEMKQFVDKTTRYFWAASYGQIYPELRRLEEAGLLSSKHAPAGARARTEYELTEAGQQALRAWLDSDSELVSELRDEGMLKLFFSDVLPARRIANLQAMRRQAEADLAQLRLIEPMAARGPLGPQLTLELGLLMAETTVRWCLETERRLREQGEGDG